MNQEQSRHASGVDTESNHVLLCIYGSFVAWPIIVLLVHFTCITNTRCTSLSLCHIDWNTRNIAHAFGAETYESVSSNIHESAKTSFCICIKHSKKIYTCFQNHKGFTVITRKYLDTKQSNLWPTSWYPPLQYTISESCHSTLSGNSQNLVSMYKSHVHSLKARISFLTRGILRFSWKFVHSQERRC